MHGRHHALECRHHARRKLFEVHEATKSPIAEAALRRIQALYQIEADITGRSVADREAERRARSKPLLEELKSKRKLVPTVDGVSFQAARSSTAPLQFQGRSSLSLEARCPRANWSMA